jgi:ketosteroid isomerase-like protein
MAKPVTESDIASLVAQVEESADALIGGDIDRYLTLIHHSEDYALFTPAGGPARRGFDDSPESRKAMARMFQSGSAKLELVETYASGDLAVLVGVERQHGVISGRPEQDCSLRVTWVFRRTESGWELAHRHADPLLRPISLEQLAALTNG